MPSRCTILLLAGLLSAHCGCASPKNATQDSNQVHAEAAPAHAPSQPQANAAPPVQPGESAEPAVAPAPTEAAQAPPASAGPQPPRYADVDWPHLKIDLNNKVVEIAGYSGINEGWLEQIICLVGKRVHESVLITEASPSHIHAALLLIGLEPGRPGWWKIDPEDPEGRKWIVEPPTGAKVSITVEWTDEAGQKREVPVHQWVRDYHTHELLPDGPWIFGGSMMKADYTGKVGYLADRTGSIAGLVTFGDELLGWCEVLPDQEAVMAPEWQANTEAMPEPYTPVTIRLRASQ